MSVVVPFRRVADLAGAIAAVRAAEAVHGVVALPTETFYGLAAAPSDATAVSQIFALKRRPAARALLVVAADLAAVERLAAIPSHWHEWLEHVWPAPLTVVLPRPVASGGDATVAVRVPDHALLRSLLAEVGPLTATSANLSGQPPSATVGDVLHAFPSGLSAILDGGTTPGGAASTLVDLCGEAPLVLRPGPWTPPSDWAVKVV